MTQGISAVIITLNEEKNIANAILSVKPWVQEVIVVDMMSDDETQNIARSLGALVYVTPRVAAFDGARSIGVEHATFEWILIIDADEMVPLSLSRELVRIATLDLSDACQVPRLNYIMGKPMLHGLHGPRRDFQLRFCKKDMLDISDRVHSFISTKGKPRVRMIEFSKFGAIHHFNAATAFQLIEKMNRYTTTEAEQLLSEFRLGSAWRVSILPPLIFMRSLILHSGWRDGWRGLYWAWFMGFYRATREAKHLQRTLQRTKDPSKGPYSDEAVPILLEYTLPFEIGADRYPSASSQGNGRG